MFDSITCELPLPLNKKEQKTFSNINWNEIVFQTKDTDCTLSSYIIRKNGKLYGLSIEGKNVRVISEKEEKKIKKQGRFCWPYEFKEKSRKYKFEKFTGDLCFYDSIYDGEGNEWWVEFTAKFVDGNLQGKIRKIKIKFERTAKEIKKNEDDYQKSIEADRKKFHNRFRKFMNKITFNYWRYTWFSIGKGIRKIRNSINNFDIWINRYVA
jgi:hypothetical protein